jgi:hypothetical protein
MTCHWSSTVARHSVPALHVSRQPVLASVAGPSCAANAIFCLLASAHLMAASNRKATGAGCRTAPCIIAFVGLDAVLRGGGVGGVGGVLWIICHELHQTRTRLLDGLHVLGVIIGNDTSQLSIISAQSSVQACRLYRLKPRSSASLRMFTSTHQIAKSPVAKYHSRASWPICKHVE